jgi:hypothetical protein
MTLKPTYTIKEFLADFGMGKTRFYELVNSGALKARKNGARTVVLAADAQAYIDSLPEYEPRKAA